MHDPVLRRLAVGLAAPVVLVLGLAACGAGDASRSDVQEELEEADLTEAQAECVTDRLFDELDQDQINELYEADEDDEIDADIEETFTTAATECATE